MKRYKAKKDVEKMTYSVKSRNRKKTDIEVVIENNNREYNAYLKKIEDETAEIRKVRENRDKYGIVPDPAFIEKLRAELIEAGIIEKTGGLTAPYRGKD